MQFTRRSFLKSAAAIGCSLAAPAALPLESQMKRTIPGTGEQIAAVGLGTWQVFDVAGNAPKLREAHDTLEAFVRLGGQLVDSSPMYGSAESVTGQVAAELGVHPRLFIATKVWTRGRDAGVREMEQSLRRLRVDLKGPLDLMQVHNLVDARTHLETLRAWKKEGRVRYIGITHYHAGGHADLEAHLRAGGIDFVQVNYSLAEREADGRLLDAARTHGAAVIINRPFAEGALFARVKGHALPGFAAELGCASWSQLFLKWILGHPAVTCVIPGTRNPRHIEDNLGALAGPVPDAAMRKRIAGHFQRL